MHFGVDVSSNNAHPIDWRAAFIDLATRGAGAQPFAIIKVDQGTGYVNPFEPADLAQARLEGFALAGYLMDEGTADPTAEQALYTRLVGALPQTDDDELPDGLSTSDYITHLDALIRQNPAALQYLNQSEVQEGYHVAAGLWLAQYNGQPGVTRWPCLMHQYDDNGTVAGIGNPVDMNAWCGTEEQFGWFFGGLATTSRTDLAVPVLV